MNFDYNLLKVLAVILETRNTTTAAERLCTSQPAVSRSLRKIRDLFNDDILVRKGTNMELTPKAEEIKAQLSGIINDIDATKVQSTVTEFKAAGHRVLGIVADISQPAAVTAMVDQAVGEFGRLDILVNNAGLEKAGPLRKLTEADWDLTIDVNLKGNFHVLQAAGQLMTMQGAGSIVLFSSIRSLVTEPGQSVYSMTKSGIVQLVRTAATEWGQTGVRVNAVVLITELYNGVHWCFRPYPPFWSFILHLLLFTYYCSPELHQHILHTFR